MRDCLTSLGYSPLEGQVYGLNRATPGNSGWPERSRGAWFAPGIQPTSNGQEIVDLLRAAGKELVAGPSFNPHRDEALF